MHRYLFALLLAGCAKQPANELRVAATPVPHAQILEAAKSELKAQGINLVIVVTDDYNIPNRALAESEVDANFFQHAPYLEKQMEQFGYQLHSLGSIEIEPMGLYSTKKVSLAELGENATIAIPNDPSNEERALLLLKQLNIKAKTIQLDAAMLPRALPDVDAAIINTNYALDAHLTPIALESADSPYANILVIRAGDETRPEIIALQKALTSETVRKYIEKEYRGAILPAGM